MTHSIKLIEDLCVGCTDCIKRCPTNAIRVRNGKAKIKDELCIDCGMCIRVCKNKAKTAVMDSLADLKNYKYKIALPAPSLYAQFKNVLDTNKILTSFKKLGFDDVFEVSCAAEKVTAKTKEYISKNIDVKKPLISSACPVIIRLIALRFPELIDNILPIIPPMELAAKIARQNAMAKGIRSEDIGIFFISPCAAKKTNTKYPFGIEKSEVDAVISIADIYVKLRFVIANLHKDEIQILNHSTHRGMNWASIGGEIKNIRLNNTIAVDGMENVINVFEQLENGQIKDVDFIEANSCTGGCIGGPFVVDNCFVAQNTLMKIQNNMALKGEETKRFVPFEDKNINYFYTEEIPPQDILKLDLDVASALHKLSEIERIFEQLPKIDCGACGCSTCRILAEDIVQGEANMEDCIFMLRNRIINLAESMFDLTKKLPKFDK